jgi:hypothetical protein
MLSHTKIISICMVAWSFHAAPSFAYFLDGEGYFGAKGETRVAPEFQKGHGTYQATEYTFDLTGEVKANDRASFHLRLGIFEDPSQAYMGDDAQPTQCTGNSSPNGSDTSSTNCTDRNQSVTHSGYRDYRPVIREAYAKYAFNHCLLSVGRRSRELGLGLLYSAARHPFDQDPSIFDGVTCDVNVQKQQDLGIYFGYDKLQETGSALDPTATRDRSLKASQNQWGANAPTDDLDQYFFGLTMDNVKTRGTSSSFSYQVALYFANILGTASKTDVKYLDLYNALYFSQFSFKNEIVFRMGKSADPNLEYQGGKLQGDSAAYTEINNLQSIGLAGQLEYTFSRSGAVVGPSEFNEGNATRHLAFLTYAYAPGDPDGYYKDDGTRTDKNVTAMSFHKNYKPALLMFNGKATSRYLNRGGAFDSERVTNSMVYTLGYRYESIENGNIETKYITGRLLNAMPEDAKAEYEANTSTIRPVGYKGATLGHELDIVYNWQYRREVDLGLGLAGAVPGDAWKVHEDTNTTMQIGLMGSFAVKF